LVHFISPLLLQRYCFCNFMFKAGDNCIIFVEKLEL